MPSSPSSLPHHILNSACCTLTDVVVTAPWYKFAALPTELLLLILDIGAASSRPFCLTLSLVSRPIRNLANRHLYRTLDERLLLWLKDCCDNDNNPPATSNANAPLGLYRDLATLSFTSAIPPRQNALLADALINVNLLKSPSGSPLASRIVRLRSSVEDDLKAAHGLSISLSKLLTAYPNVKNVAISLVELVHALQPERQRSTNLLIEDNNGDDTRDQPGERTNATAAVAAGVQLIIDVTDPKVWDDLEHIYQRYQQQQPSSNSHDETDNNEPQEPEERVVRPPSFTSAVSRIHLTGFPINARILLMLSALFPNLTHLAASFCWTRALDELLTGSSTLEQYIPNLSMLVFKLIRGATDMVWLGEPERVGRTMNEDGSSLLVHVRDEARLPTTLHHLTGQCVHVFCDAWPGTAAAAWAEGMESRDVFKKARADTVDWLARRGRQC
jgi:hypothetical protein